MTNAVIATNLRLFWVPAPGLASRDGGSDPFMKKARRIIAITTIGIFLLFAAILLAMKIRKESAMSRIKALPYDYDEAVVKLNQYCGSFPTSFGNADDCVFLNDLTGDGVEDLCTFVFFGSGMPRMDIVMYDVQKDKFYTLDGWDFRGAYGYNYRILSSEKYGIVISERQFYPEEHDVKFGLLTFENEKLGMDEFDEESSEYEHAKDLWDEISLKY